MQHQQMWVLGLQIWPTGSARGKRPPQDLPFGVRIVDAGVELPGRAAPADELLLLRFVKERWSPSCGFPNLQVGLDSKFTRDTPSMLLSTLLSYLFWVSPGLID